MAALAANIIRGAGIRLASRAGLRLAGGSILKTIVKKVIPKSKPLVSKGLSKLQKTFFGTRTRSLITQVGAGALITSPTLRKKVKEEPLLIAAPAVVLGKKAGEVGELLKDKGKDVSPKELAAIGGAAGLAAAGVIAAGKIIKDKKEEKALTGVQAAVSGASQITKTKPAGEIPTTIPQAEKEKVFKQAAPTIKVSVNPKFNTIIQNTRW